MLSIYIEKSYKVERYVERVYHGDFAWPDFHQEPRYPGFWQLPQIGSMGAARDGRREKAKWCSSGDSSKKTIILFSNIRVKVFPNSLLFYFYNVNLLF